MVFGSLDHEQRKAILERLGLPPAQACRLSPNAVLERLGALWGNPTHRNRLEFEILRQLGRAWDADEIS